MTTPKPADEMSPPGCSIKDIVVIVLAISLVSFLGSGAVVWFIRRFLPFER